MTSSRDDARTLRQRQHSLAAALDRAATDDGPGGGIRLVRTQLAGSAASRMYQVRAVSLAVDEAEGAVPSFVESSGVFYVLNLGTTTIPTGTVLLAELVGGRWVTSF